MKISLACLWLMGMLLLPNMVAGATNSIDLTGHILPLPGTTNFLNFKTESGAFYKMLRTPMSEALFADTNLLSKVLVLKGRVSDSNAFEVTGNLHSLKNGQLNELYYYCDVCSIKTSVPGLCLCCRDPVRLVERAVKAGSEE